MCPFNHPTKALDTADTAADDLEEPNQNTDINSSKRYLYGALVHFSDGASISSFSLASDFSAVRLNGLEATDTADSVLKLASALGFTLAEDAVRMVRDVGGSVSAIISVAEPKFAVSFCGAMKGDPSFKKIAALPTISHLPTWVVQRRVNCRKVNVSWFRPNRLVWLNFGTQNVAKRTCDKFNGGRYLVNGERISASEPTGTRASYRRGRCGFHNAQGWTVVLKGVASHATRSGIANAIRDSYDEPHHIELDRPSFEYDPEIVPYLVESMLMSIGPLDFFTVPQLRGQRMKSIAQFTSEKDARHAVKALHEQQQKYLNGGKLYLQSRSSSKIKVSTKVFNAVQDQLQPYIPTWQAQHLAFRTYADTDPSKRFVALKLEGENTKEVAKASKLLEQLLSGRVVKDGDSPFWRESLTGNGPSYQFVKEVQKAEKHRARQVEEATACVC